MKNLILFILLLSLSFSFSASAEFMSSFDDIPLQSGLIEEDSLSFDIEDLRIIEQNLSSQTLTRADFLNFYKESLKSLGWSLISYNSSTYLFKRENEGLTITIQSSNPLVVSFTLKPYGK